jgi:hypothetical protein
MLFLFLACWRADASSHPVPAKPMNPHSHEREAVRGKEVSRVTRGNTAASERRAATTKAVPRKEQPAAHLRATSLREAGRRSNKGAVKEPARKSPGPLPKVHAVEHAKLAVTHEAMPDPKETPEEPAEDTVHVTHDRKIHHSGEEPRKATAEDFMPDPVTAGPVKAVDVPRPSARAKQAPELAKPDRAKPVADAIASLPRVTAAQTVTQAIGKTVAKGVAEPLPIVTPVLYTKSGRLIVPAALKGSHEILVHQNEVADQEGLSRVHDDEDLASLRDSRMIVPLPKAQGLVINEGLPENRRYCRPWTAEFLVAMAKAHYARFHRPLQVNSAVRTVEVQERLLRTNGNAAPTEGETASPHLTGQAVDLAKKGLSITEIAWLRGYLLPLVQQGKVDVEEEFQQSCFHISVYKKYLPQPAPRREIAAGGHSPVNAIAAAVR